MIDSHSWFRLQAFRRFWEIEISKHPQDRFVPIRFKHNIFRTHERNMVKIGLNYMGKKSTDNSKFVWKGYRNISIPESKVSEVERFVTDEKNVFFSYNQMLVNGYQIKQYFDEKSESIKTVATCFDDKSVNFGHALSAYAEDWYTSLAVLMYKHFEIADGDWEKSASNTLKSFG